MPARRVRREIRRLEVEGRREEVDASSLQYCCSSLYARAELQRLAVRAVGGAVAVSFSYGLSNWASWYSVRLLRFCSLTALTPHSLAALNRSMHVFSLPWWLCPTSAMT